MSARDRTITLVLLVLLLAACSGSTVPTAIPLPTTVTQLAQGATNTPLLPTATPVPPTATAVPPTPMETPVPPTDAPPPTHTPIPLTTTATPPISPTSAARTEGVGSIPECVQAYIKTLDSRAEFSGAVLVAHDGEPIFKGAYGLANRAQGISNQIDTKFNLGSMDKMFTAVAILQLTSEPEEVFVHCSMAE